MAGEPAGARRRGGIGGRVGDAWAVLRDALAEAREDRVTTTAQALAYSLFLAIPSVFLVLLGVFSLVADAGDVSRLIDRAAKVMPEEAASLLGNSLERSTRSTGGGVSLTVVGLVLALWSTTSAATTLMQGITTAFDRNDERGFVRKRGIALVLVACLVGAAVLIVSLLVLGPQLQRWVGNASGAPTVIAWVWWTAQWPILVAGLLFAFAILLYLGPDAEQPGWRLITPGAVAALVIWLAASGGFAFYTANFGSYNKTWGTLAAVVITLIWLWLTSAALLLGAEINAAAQRLATARDRRGPPAGGARPDPSAPRPVQTGATAGDRGPGRP
jgi:membrane protein